ncbi:hypothetical protein KP509_09G012000 [Ceratopteris richardii]|uniref:VHS domain-containing protein n=1 Tax=Ceratopteris richardii TaxID=49495 RepID=A0A8T2TZ11_CERRI|nr:hypothetical protein KP509_09G012000 [Ceratopteris richardii]KAH7428686.1 hypothetical protein KP509_09G012000 [Ceratopteris richardii]KAH7428687.1 hypothetical protein KP509_09G012000 [Ceratopteris richardii]KAH7428688.1 hypothetical protein KP509_09G012000 [Ceratopteris richardii]KAH7428689.1 hypothetical protein KP509_09G012000 [Ceratopteris richardii]
MESSKRAVEAYKRTRLVDYVITDDDNVAPIYRLDEIAEMLRTSTSDMVREVVEYSMKRLDSRSPRVKQKVLRMIKYTVGKSGPEFKRQIQRQAADIRQLFEYKGQPDVLRGDALNKAVRETAHEAIAAIFASDDKPPQAEELNKRIMGFGSQNYEDHAAVDLKKPSLTNIVNDVLEFGSTTIKQGLTMISEYSGTNIGNMKNSTGSYRSPGLMSSLTSERASTSRFDQEDRGSLRSPVEGMSMNPRQVGHLSETNAQESMSARDVTNTGQGHLSSTQSQFLDAITAPGGMRLQPTRESIQKLLTSLANSDKTDLCCALEKKLRSPAWQTRFKSLCIIEAIMRQHNDQSFGQVSDYFKEDSTLIRDCLQSPQSSLRDKATKVLNELNSSSKGSNDVSKKGPVTSMDASKPIVVYEMPDLIDTGDPDLLTDARDVPQLSKTGDSLLEGDLLGESFSAEGAGPIAKTGPDDEFAGVSFLTEDERADNANGDLFSGLSLNKTGTEDLTPNGSHEDIEVFTTTKQLPSSDSLADLLGDVTLNVQKEASFVGHSQNGSLYSQPALAQASCYRNAHPYNISGKFSYLQTPQMTSSAVRPQMTHLNTFAFQQMGMFPNHQVPTFSSTIPHQQEHPSGMVGLNRDTSQAGSGRILGDSFDFSGGGVLHPVGLTADSEKRENMKAFEFISDHISAARSLKKYS